MNSNYLKDIKDLPIDLCTNMLYTYSIIDMDITGLGFKVLFVLLYSFGKEVQRNENQKMYFYSFYGICVILLYGVIYATENLVSAFMYHI